MNKAIIDLPISEKKKKNCKTCENSELVVGSPESKINIWGENMNKAIIDRPISEKFENGNLFPKYSDLL